MYHRLLHVGYIHVQPQGMDLHDSGPRIMPSEHSRWHNLGIDGEFIVSTEHIEQIDTWTIAA